MLPIVFLALSLAAPEVVLFEAPSLINGRVFVIEEGHQRYLRFARHGEDQSWIDTRNPAAMPMEYLQTAAISLLLVPRPKAVAIIGMGGGGFSSFVLKHFPEVQVDAVEIDPVVVLAAQRFFFVTKSERLKIFVEDGERFIRRSRARYDVILLDAYDGSDIPLHLTSTRFFGAARARLREGGWAVANVALDDPEEEARVVRAFRQTFSGRNAYCVQLRSRASQNRVLLGRKGAAGQKGVMRRAIEETARRFGFAMKEVSRTRGRCF